MEIENIDKPVSFNLDSTAINRLTEFKNKISTEGVICSSDVLALEEFIGNKVVTSVVNPNRLTNIPSLNGVKEVCEAIDSQLEESKEVSKVTYSELVDIVSDVDYSLKNIRESLVSSINININTGEDSIFAKFKNKDIRYWYNSGDEIIDLLDAPLHEVLINNTSFLNKVLGSERTEVLANIGRDEIFTLLCAFKGKKFANFLNHPDINIVEITLNDILDIFTSPGGYIKDIDILMDHIKCDKNDIRDNSKWIASDIADLNREFKKYSMLRDVINDEASLTVLRILYNSSRQ